MSDTLNSPQGDGNDLEYLEASIAKNGSDTLNSPQGDGNNFGRCYPLGCDGLQSDTLNSPQGDGNIKSSLP